MSHSSQEPQMRVLDTAPITRESRHYHEEETVKRSSAARPLHAIKNNILGTLGDDRAQEKKMDKKIQQQFETGDPSMIKPTYDKYKAHEEKRESFVSENIPEADTSFNLNDTGMLNMILKEDKYIKQVNQSIPDDVDRASARTSERNQILGWPKKQTESVPSYERLSTTPQKAQRIIPQDSIYTDYMHPYNSKGSFKDYNSQTTGYSEVPKYDYQQESPEKVKRSFRDEQKIEEWPSRRFKELPIYKKEESSDEDDDGTNFCGLCVSKRKKKPTKRD